METGVPDITVVIPCREHESADITVDSLAGQTYKNFKIVIQKDQGMGANWARNRGFMQCDTEFVLFSDNDISWRPGALETMHRILKKFPKASYCYGRFKLGDVVWGHEPFNAEILKNHNYISTMSLMRAKDFPGFDESIHRLQDWDLWLTMLEQGKRGIYCEDLIFTTEVRSGITHGGPDYIESEVIVRRKHGLKQFLYAESTGTKI